GNSEMILDRKLQERRTFPAINIPASGTRREELLLSPETMRQVILLRKMQRLTELAGMPDGELEVRLGLFERALLECDDPGEHGPVGDMRRAAEHDQRLRFIALDQRTQAIDQVLFVSWGDQAP
ncbi:MAG TPA: hypothetical protein VGT60_04245, partial [Candidatus Limnocylindria bacterium]|nr:hypothetical protein [Candidatus Limnocylindria bacterium]